ncbi:RnfH family protein [Teredinibacter turnerae]|uniref:RnfH family protein n=1 Tax=Teredinibacter turnerae TaxID=2426 RepID=UPI00040669B1|nr:RnfH family protein [Teredinibacter turnerae]
MRVGLIYAGETQVMLQCQVDDNTTVGDAIESSGILRMCQDIDLKRHKVGIYGRFVKLNNVLKEGDRIEIYRKITRVLDDDDDDEDDDD